MGWVCKRLVTSKSTTLQVRGWDTVHTELAPRCSPQLSGALSSASPTPLQPPRTRIGQCLCIR